MTKILPPYLSRAKFAKLRGLSRSRVTQLAQAGRLVLSEDGKLVEVQASIRRLEETQRVGPPVLGKPTDPSSASGAGPRSGRRRASDLEAYNAARTRREQAAAETVEIELRKRKGELVEVDQVRAAAAKIAGVIARGFEGIVPRLGAVWTVEADAATRERLLDAELAKIRDEWAAEISMFMEPPPAGAVDTSAP